MSSAHADEANMGEKKVDWIGLLIRTLIGTTIGNIVGTWIGFKGGEY